MTNSDYAHAFEKLLDRKPTDWLARAIYSDLLEEMGDFEYAAAQRWMVDNKKRARRLYPKLEDSDWLFGRLDNNACDHRIYRVCLLPPILFSQLTGGNLKQRFMGIDCDPWWRFYPDRVTAERDLGRALLELESLEVAAK